MMNMADWNLLANMIAVISFFANSLFDISTLEMGVARNGRAGLIYSLTLPTDKTLISPLDSFFNL